MRARLRINTQEVTMTAPMPKPRVPIEAKVQAGTLSAVVGGIAVWALQTYVFRGNISPGLMSLIYAAVPGLLALAGGYLAPHSPRPLPPVTRTLPGNVTVTPVPGTGPPPLA